MNDNAPTFETAEGLRKGKQFPDACAQFSQLWQQKQDSYVGWRYAFCLRKLGRLNEAEKVAKETLLKFPNDQYTKSELGWILYEKEIKPAKEESDLGRVVHFAIEILALNSDTFALRLIATAVMKVAKGKKKWDVVLEWSDKLKPADLSTEARLFDGKRGMSERETWYVGRSRALLELKRYEEARGFAQQGLREFPNEIFLARTAALAAARMGNLEEAAGELRNLQTHPRADWYLKADLAEVEHLRGNNAEAFRLMCDAMTNSQDDEYKLKNFVTLGQIALALGRNEIAAEHVALAKAVRAANNWSLPEELIELEKAVRQTFARAGQDWPMLPTNDSELSRLCHRRWREGKVEGLTFIRGTLGSINPEKPFAFIKREDSGESVFVLLRDIPRQCAREGARLEFTLKKSFDKKKNRESVQAADIRCLRD
jgi:tetratricopeptide (TPR) repeat protein/cold shock CspA family protein